MADIQKSLDVLVVGELNVDLILNQLESFPEMGKEKLAQQMTLTLGSSSAIFAANIAALGARTAFLGMIGQDDFGNLVLRSLQEKGVQTEYIVRSEHHQTGITVVLNFDNDRAMVTYPGAMAAFSVDDVDFSVLNQARHLHFSSYFLQPGMQAGLRMLLQAAKDAGLTTSLDVQWDPAERWDFDYPAILPLVDVFLPNEAEVRALTGEASAIEGGMRLARHGHWVVVKQGIHGATAIKGRSVIQHRGYKNEAVVDAIGAGDSFNAGFIYQFIQGKPIEDCLKFANLMGAINTTAAGGTGAFTSREAIEATARERFGEVIQLSAEWKS